MRLTSFGHAAFLVETEHDRILVDPWLTPTLDRFWERWPAAPPGLLDVLADGVDHIVFSHHHFDHHHFPSLRLLAELGGEDFDETPGPARAAHCVWPRGTGPPRFTDSGLGHQAIGWTLRRLGFPRSTGVRPGDTVRLGEATLRTFPSRVPFPEMSLLIEDRDAAVLLCGDAILHPETERWLARPDRRPIDLAVIPAHSLAPPGVLTLRRPVADPAAVRARAADNFDRYVTAVDAAFTVPGSFGWRVRPDSGFGWCNAALFPLTPRQAADRLAALGRPGALVGPGQRIEVNGDTATRTTGGGAIDVRYDFAAINREVTLAERPEVPAFDPATDRVGWQRTPAAVLVERLADHLVGSEFWYAAAEDGSRHLLRVSGDDGTAHTFVLDPGAGRVLPASRAPRPGPAETGHTEVAASTLDALFAGELLFGSSYGLWTSDSALLSAVFHHPRFYVRHVERFLAGGFTSTGSGGEPLRASAGGEPVRASVNGGPVPGTDRR